jgi:hypothetical protein
MHVQKINFKQKRRGFLPRLSKKLRGLHHFLHPFFHVLGCHVFNVSSNAP